jgi:xanthine dehydrogenase YagS FAD-binding subunit
MKSFEYAAPKNLKDAVALLGEKWGETEILAGGTDLITCLKQGIVEPRRVVSLKNISDLRGIKTGGGNLRIGAMTRLGELAANKDIQKHFSSLVTAVNNIASPQILTAGTVGGDLCQRPRCWYYRNGLGLLGTDGSSPAREGDNRYHAIFSTDSPALFVNPSSLAPALIALGAILTIDGGGKGKAREVSVAEFFKAPKSENEREYDLAPNEVLTSISIPMRGLKNGTYEVRHRQGLDWPYVTASVAYAQKDGSVSDAKIVLGHVAATPWVANSASAALKNTTLDQAAIERCAENAVEGAKPLSNNRYKVQMVKTAVKRALAAAQAA